MTERTGHCETVSLPVPGKRLPTAYICIPCIPQPVQYKLGVTVHRCLQKAPQYQMDCCMCTSNVSSRQRLTSANRQQLMVPQRRRNTFGRLAFSIASLMEWNSLPDSLWDPARSTGSFRLALKTHLFATQ